MSYDIEISGSKTTKLTAANTTELFMIAKHSTGGLVSVARGQYEVFAGTLDQLADACEMVLECGREL